MIKREEPSVPILKERAESLGYQMRKDRVPVREDTVLFDDLTRTIMDTVREPILILDDQWRVRKTNPAFCSMFGLKKEETRGLTLDQLAEGIFNIPEMQKALSAAKPPKELRLPIMDQNGIQRNIRITIRRLPIGTNQTGAQLLVLHSLGSAWHSQDGEFLGEEMRDPFKIMAENAPVMIWTADRSRRRTYFNPSWLKFRGRTLKQESGHGWIHGIHPDDLERSMRIYNTAFDKKVSFKKEYRLRYRDGSYRWVLSTGVPIIRDGIFYGYVGSCTDINYRVEQEKLKEDFIAAASHELKTPLTIIKIYTELLKESMIKVQQPEPIQLSQKLDGQVNRLTWLIREMLDVSKMASESIQLVKESFHMVSLIGEVVEDMQTTTDTHVLTQKTSILKEIWGDKEKIRQVLVNLISNAIKYSPGADRIDIITRQTAKGVQVSVRDYGIGIPVAMQDRIFERFYRAADKENTYPGIGLGLYICSEIIKSHGGKIWFTSVEGTGSEFCFTLPWKRRRT